MGKKLRRGLAYAKRHGISQTARRLFLKKKERKKQDRIYALWRETNLPTPEELQRQREETFFPPVKISVVVPVYRTPDKYLREMLTSLQNQTYRDFELCLAVTVDDNCKKKETEHIAEIIEGFRPDLPQIVVKNLEQNRGIAENTNAAIELATGDVVAFMDHDDTLSPDALYEVAKAFAEDDRTDIVYSDQDKLRDETGEYADPLFKKDYDYVMLLSFNYLSHFFAARRRILDALDALNRPEFDGAQDYDLILRLTEKADRIVHVPKPLYHWREHANSTAMDPESKGYAYEAGRHAIEAHFHRVGSPVRVSFGERPGLYRVDFSGGSLPDVKELILDDEKQDEEENKTNILRTLKESEEDFLFVRQKDLKTGTVLPKLFAYALMEQAAAVMPRILSAKEKEDITESAAYFQSIATQSCSELRTDCVLLKKSAFDLSGNFFKKKEGYIYIYDPSVVIKR